MKSPEDEKQLENVRRPRPSAPMQPPSQGPGPGGQGPSHGYIPSPLYSFVRGRQLEGTYPGSPQTGYWIVTALRVHKGWGAPQDADWPVHGRRGWPPVEPQGMDEIAKKDRLFAYGRVRTLDDARRLLANGHPFGLGSDVAQADARVMSYTYEDVGVVCQKVPAGG